MLNIDEKFNTTLDRLVHAIQKICRDIEFKYEENFDEDERDAQLVLDEIRYLDEEVIKWLGELEPLIIQANDIAPNKVKFVTEQHKKITAIVSFVQQLKELEEAMIKQKEAKDIIDKTNLLNEIKVLFEEFDISENISLTANLASNPLTFISSEVSMRQYQLYYKLEESFEKTFKLPKRANKGRMTEIIVTRDAAKNLKEVNEFLTAMNISNLLNERIDAWSYQLTKVVIPAIIASRDGKDVFKYSLDYSTGLEIHKFAISVPKPLNKPMELDGVLGTIEFFFEKLSLALDDIELLDGTGMLKRLIGRSISQNFASMLLNDCIKVVASSSQEADNDGSAYAELIERGEQSIEKLADLGFLPVDCKLFYKENKDKLLINHKCCAILGQAKRLINESLHQHMQVGDGEEAGEDEADFREDNSYSSTFHPPLYRLCRMVISTSCNQFVNLVNNTIEQAMENKDDEAIKEKLLLTARNIVSLYVILSPRVHSSQISSIPSIAAVFYNNCFFLCHQLMVRRLNGLAQLNAPVVDHMFSESITKLRDTAANAMENFLKQSKREIVTTIDRPELYSNLPAKLELKSFFPDMAPMDEQKEQPKLVKSLTACLHHIGSLAKVLREMQTEVVFCKTIGALANFMLEIILQRILSIDDIKERDAYALAELFDLLLKDLDDIFMFRGKSRVNEFCSKQTGRLIELIFCLKSGLQGIEMRWGEKKGPLAEAFTGDEMIRLVRALFADTKNRQQLQKKIEMS